ncbi:hypothetical protein Glove_49g10 [Diversispora epigaea]|uniref:DUF659 domain-containing protein n=1 Tax=Diversispora epigaea TaxID=1348612 RepID=A0A397JKQ5_9GLOM|nr:hypothetical protein Glove_49g10 [Diversispora epigaea]
MKKKLSNETNLTLGLDGWTSPAGQSLYIFLIMTTEMKKKLSNETNLTLGLDGWTSPAGQSLYIFLIMTSDGKEYIHSLRNFSKNSHTGEFLKNKIIKVIEEVGAEKFCSIVSDHASNILENESQLLNLEIISILRKQNFFRNVKDLRTILLPIKKAIINLEHKSTTLADCFINIVIMATAIKELSQTNTGLQINTFRIICEKALSIWKLLGGREKSAKELIAQISNYSLKSKPYDFEFVTGIHTVKNW